jgi:hypothetical protein
VVQQPARVRFYGCPAEESLGWVPLVKAGRFEDFEIAVTWHPADVNIPPPLHLEREHLGGVRVHEARYCRSEHGQERVCAFATRPRTCPGRAPPTQD